LTSVLTVQLRSCIGATHATPRHVRYTKLTHLSGPHSASVGVYQATEGSEKMDLAHRAQPMAPEPMPQPELQTERASPGHYK